MDTSRLDQINKAAQKKKSGPKESTINSNARLRLDSMAETICFKYHGTNFSHKGHSDIYGVSQGIAFFFEGKCPGKKPTAAQDAFLEDAKAAGAITGVYHSADEAQELLINGLKERGFSHG